MTQAFDAMLREQFAGAPGHEAGGGSAAPTTSLAVHADGAPPSERRAGGAPSELDAFDAMLQRQFKGQFRLKRGMTAPPPPPAFVKYR